MNRREFLKLLFLGGIFAFTPVGFRLKSPSPTRRLGDYKPKGRFFKFYPPSAEVVSHLKTANGVRPKYIFPNLKV